MSEADTRLIPDALWREWHDLAAIPFAERHRWRLAPVGMGEGEAHRWARAGGFDRLIRIGRIMAVRLPLPAKGGGEGWPGLGDISP